MMLPIEAADQPQEQRLRLARLQPDIVGLWLAEEKQAGALGGENPAEDSSQSSETATKTIDGTVLSADISGFTRLAERLAESGERQAAESLISTINRCFEPMIDEVYQRSGDVLKFGGDAIFAVFHGEDHTRQAAMAAANMQALIGTVDLGVDITLSMTVGIASGPVPLILAGTSRRELVVHGPVVDTCLALESDAEPGEVLISAETAAGLSPDWVTNPEPDVLALADLKGVDLSLPGRSSHTPGHHSLESSELATALGHELAGAVESFDQTIGEIRVVTVAFVMMPTGDRTNEEVDAVVQRAFDLSNRYGATVLSTDVATGGMKILLAAGAPTATGGDEDAMLATLADLVLDEKAPPMKAGVNRGLVFAGFLGSSRCQTFTVMGDPTNLAARLLGKAEYGSIAVSQPVLDHARSKYFTEELSPVMVKGRLQPVTVHRLQGVADSPQDRFHEPAMVGRQDVLDRLTELLGVTRRGDGQVVDLVGEAGLGTTRILRRFVDNLPGAVLHFDLQGTLHTIGDPYHAVQQFLRAAAGIDLDLDRVTAGQLLSERFRSASAETRALLPLVAPAFSAVVSADKTVAGLLEDVAPEFRQAKAKTLIVDLLADALTVPTVMVIEDAHWIDEASRELLAAIASESHNHPWMVLATSRTGTAGLSPDADNQTTIELGPLDFAEVKQLVLSVRELPDGLASAVANQSGGNPLFAMELARNLRGEASLPDSIEGVITSRIDRLGHDTRALVRSAAVLGSTFDIELLSEMIGRDPTEALRSAEQLIAVENQTGAFRSDVITKVAYNGLSGLRRAELHGAAAAALEQRDADVSQLALHHAKAGHHTKAWTYNQEAAERAKTLGIMGAAAEHLLAAIDAAKAAGANGPPPEDLTMVMRECFDLLMATKRYGKAEAVGEETLSRLTDPIAHARLLAVLGSAIGEASGAYSSHVDRLKQALETIDRSDDDPSTNIKARSWIHNGLASLYFRLDKLEIALTEVEAAVTAAESVDYLAPLPPILLVRQMILAGRADPSRVEVGEKLLAVAGEVGDTRTLIQAHNNLGLDLVELGRWEEGVTNFQTAIELAAKLGADDYALLPAINTASVALDRGQWDTARAELQELSRDAIHHRSGFEAAFVQAELGRLEINAGRPQIGREALASALTWFEDAEVLANVYEVKLSMAAADIAEGHPAEALAILESLEPPEDLVAQQLGRRETLIGYAEMQRGAPEEAEASLSAAVSKAEEVNVFGHALALVALSEALQFLGRGRAAKRARAEADETLERLGVIELPAIPLPK